MFYYLTVIKGRAYVRRNYSLLIKPDMTLQKLK